MIAPSSKTTRTLMAVLAAITGFGGLTTFLVASRGATGMAGSRALGSGLVMLLAGAFTFGFLWLWSANTRLLIGNGVVGYRNAVGRERMWARGEIACAIEMAINFGWWASSSNRGIYVVGLDGRRLLVLSTVAWRADDLHDFFAEAGVTVEVRLAPVKIKDAKREFPNAFGWGSTHVLLATSLTFLVAVVLVVGGYVILSSAH
ncbi:MAG TPA: hypothetical protein VJQ08_04405 [Candidatus Dormibacteraeota bacterium]|nr:hypothetical protein [Candidatus Dormibacteraeota bacterium]